MKADYQETDFLNCIGPHKRQLLDNCVKNCGYPFHLQIASKEFLNALVRKFPERPLTVPTPVQNRILEMIQEWYTTLCKTSRYKEDLVHIRDMHRLLSFKGYRFPQTRKTAAAVLNPADSLKTPAELEEEDRVAHSARLQELIRRGRPEDVRAANELVKMMTGFDLFGTCKAVHPKVQSIISEDKDPDNI
ncbi:hypothetical protein BGX21_002970, partial [Mortierella sp. AD011]